jgi:ABC-type transporter Mla subunit MlaD
MATTKRTKKPVAKKTSAKSSVEKVEAAVIEATEEVSDQATSLFNSLNKNVETAQTVAKQFWFAGLGAVGKTVDEVQGRYDKVNQDIVTRYTKINQDRQDLVKDLVVRGEKVQDEAEVLLKEGRANIEEQIEVARGRMSGLVSVIDIPARLKDMSDKLESLSKDLKKTG